METLDAIGPLGAKSMSESPFNPVAPAFANALRDTTGVRFTETPVTRDVEWRSTIGRCEEETHERLTPASCIRLSNSQMRFREATFRE